MIIYLIVHSLYRGKCCCVREVHHGQFNEQKAESTNCIINSFVGITSLSSCLIDGGRRTNIYCENIVTRGGCRNSWGVLLYQPTAEVNFSIKLNNCECLNAICITIRTCRTINTNTKY